MSKEKEEKKKKPEPITLNDGRKIPIMGLGTSRIANPENITYCAIKSGVRLIDTALKYENEEAVGRGIERAIKDGICKREDLTIIGKIWITERNDPEKAIRGSLDRLKLKYFDIYMDHWPSGKDYRENKNSFKELEATYKMISIYDFWKKMEKLVELKLTKSLGVSNYNIQCLCNLLSFCKIKPVVNEIEYHLFYIQKELKEFCEKQGIYIIAYYPIPHGNGAREYIRQNNGEYDVLKDSLILDLAKKYKKTPGQIILNWHHQMGTIPIPSTSKENRMDENLNSFDFELEKEDIKKLSTHFKQLSLKKFCGCRRFFGVNVLP